MLRYMLDTDICIYTINNRPPHLRDTFNRHNEHLSLSAVSLAELQYGAEKSSMAERNLAVVERFATRVEVLAFDQKAATQSGQIRAELAKAGTPIGPYDVMIAGHARSEGLILVTNNVREFSRVDGLRLENWVD
ncbi:MAG TPA: tRNA(fMet)-specific endonuclease VapC [Alphaproteobacteria bacterium]|nr:tRNA(fMet)-specific endonuclease VapC [Alphaproteobacteria bacterium]MDP6270131.1 tRNA(fMet)-specific endonuclease VapC [Alphaproteobacteria bacterium]MDP7164472.1 tRNA(fMet)-specific endonuclease VapC [Alphaproteobacteria bacterium]MDP7429802.1 tRNA(fMet)-specific endonuclease VapC [Alphaproteobacteria bacterium]HJM49607.1 tRNA(fMet)-specific endonuclease VapC [Alphaproteobacteria bacterium]